MPILHRVAPVHSLEPSKEGSVGYLLVYHLLQYKRYSSSVTTSYHHHWMGSGQWAKWLAHPFCMSNKSVNKIKGEVDGRVKLTLSMPFLCTTLVVRAIK